MAEGGAYYAAAGAANQVQPVRFGDIAMGFANVAEAKRKESAEQAKYRQDFLMKQQELFGDEIVGEFDGTGIDNIDGVAAKTKDSIKKHAEILNSLYEDGKITESQLNSRMRKLSSASAQYRGMIGNVSSFIQQHNELGGKSSKYNEAVIERLNSFTQDMLPVVNENSELVFLSRGGKKGLQQTSLSGMQDMLSAKQGVNDSDIFKGVMAGIKPTTQVKGKAVVSTYMPNGDLSQNTKNFLKEQFDTMSDDQLIDLAVKNDVDYGDGLDIEDKEALKKNLMGVYEEKTKAYLTDQEAADEVRGISLAIQRGNFEMAKAREKRATEKDEAAKRTMLKPESTVVTENVNGVEKQYAAKVWQTPIDKSYNIAPLLAGVSLNHSGAVQLTQLQQINVGTEEVPLYKYKISVYIPPSKGQVNELVASQLPAMMDNYVKENSDATPEQIEAYKNSIMETSGMSGSGHNYQTIELSEENLKKLQKFLPEDFIKPQQNLNSIFQ